MISLLVSACGFFLP